MHRRRDRQAALAEARWRQLLGLADPGRLTAHRLNRAEYENTLRDLFDMPGIALQGDLPADGSAHGFDNNSDALDISHVNMAKYVEAADLALDAAIATRPEPPIVQKWGSARGMETDC